MCACILQKKHGGESEYVCIFRDFWFYLGFPSVCNEHVKRRLCAYFLWFYSVQCRNVVHCMAFSPKQLETPVDFTIGGLRNK